ncbi:MAG: phosphate ABC transporter ATP-binding protein [Dysgonamonadaceae bacterium]|jgi:phosphate transport system ATP-binding protein|nr:phosphate ABC transporter ATP-binding protein [Dysgonamonadaceae bacterium]
MNKKHLLELKNVSVSFSPGIYAIKNVSVSIKPCAITSVIGASGAGKSTLLRSINRMHELYPNIKLSGEISLDGKNIMEMKPIEVRRRIGMVFQMPNPFPAMNIYQNVLSGYKLNKIYLSKAEKDEIVEKSLQDVALWDEVKNSLNKSALSLTVGQQQRLCIARTLALQPEFLLMDDPTSSIDPICTNRIEELMYRLKDNHTIIVVAHNLSQASRISDYAMYLEKGELVEYDISNVMFVAPKDKRTERYITEQIE